MKLFQAEIISTKIYIIRSNRLNRRSVLKIVDLQAGKMAPSTMENNNTLDGAEGDGNSNTSSLLVVILSLVFVAVFGCALIGGVISGDPTNGFFITIIVASALAISFAVGVSIRYIVSKRVQNDEADQYLTKDDIRGTLPSNDEENQYKEEESAYLEIPAKSVVGEMSALSPQSYGEDSISTFHHHIIKKHYKNGRQGLDFSRITPGENEAKRQDPPEVGLAIVEDTWETKGGSQDPSAPKFATDGKIISDDGDRYESIVDDTDAVSAKSGRSENDEVNTVKTEKRNKSRSVTSKRDKKGQVGIFCYIVYCMLRKFYSCLTIVSLCCQKKKSISLNFPSSTRSAPINSFSASSVPATPAASETGSLASSFFNMFGKNKKASSEVGVSDVTSSNTASKESSITKEKPPIPKSNGGKPPMVKPKAKPMVRPPMIPPSNRKVEDSVTTSSRTGPMPPTPGNSSTFTIPPPRPIPRTPMGSEVFSEFQSVAGSAAASSTFDLQAHQRALQKMRIHQAPIGASPLDPNAMPKYYDDDDNDKESYVAQSSVIDSIAHSYDVFAPPGALGIVVDTTEKGCIVYSLKKSSPMQGLMNRGDFIIGLDDFDVRNLSAASLTKLMAQKSEQDERKFTLVPNNS